MNDLIKTVSKKKKKNSAIYIVLGMILGIAFGFIAMTILPNGKQVTLDWIAPWGTIFITLLKMIAVPLVFISIYRGITSIKDITKFSQIGFRTIALYVVTTIFAISIGLGFALTVKPGLLVDKTKTEIVINTSSDEVVRNLEKAANKSKQGPLSFVVDMIPQNIIFASSKNSSMLQVILFAILCGIATIKVGEEKTRNIRKVVDNANDIILVIIDMIIYTAPIGVFALMADLTVSYSGNWGLFASLGVYALTVTVALFTLMFGFYPLLIHLFTKIPVRHFIKKMYPVQLFAFSTSSSAATLPLNLENAQQELGISEETSEFVLPVGTTINMDGTSCYQAIAVVFIAQVFGINLGLGDILSILLLTTLSSIGTPAIPGGSYVILTMVLTSVGIPAEGLALILGVDRPLDMLRTSVNVTGDASVAAIIDQTVKK